MEEARRLRAWADVPELGVEVDALVAPACVIGLASGSPPALLAANAAFRRWTATAGAPRAPALDAMLGRGATRALTMAVRRAVDSGTSVTTRLHRGPTPDLLHVSPLGRGERRGGLVTALVTIVADGTPLDAPVPLLDLDPEGRILDANRAAAALFDQAARTLPGAAWTELLAPGAAASGSGAGPIDGAVVEAVAGDDQVRRMRVTATAGSDGGIRVALTDLTDIAAGDGDAQRERMRLVDAVASMGDGFALYDADDRLVLVNARLKELMPRIADALRPGASHEEVLRTALARDAVAVPDADAEAWLAAHLARRERAPGEYEITTRVGRHLLIEARRTAEGGVIETVRDITTRWQRERSFEHLASHDGLTGLPNRVAFFAALRRRLETAARDGATVAVGFIDVDELKRINDGHGHAVGDAVLESVARRLAGTARVDDVIARLSGDEFAFVSAPTAGSLELDGLAERLIDAACRPVRAGGAVVPVTISLGLVRYPGDATTADDLIAAADRAMYAAKSTGGGTWRSVGG